MKNNLILFISIAILGGAIYYHFTKAPSYKAEKTIFTFFGAPGSGKGTLAEKCAHELNFNVLSTGNLCRKHIADKTELGEKIQKYTNSGKLVPDNIITVMVKGWLKENTKNNKAIILDGYPRTKKQAELLLDMLKEDFPEYSFRIIALDISDDEVVKRISNRLVCDNKKCQAVYNTSQIKNIDDPLCELCDSKLIKRDDDKEEVVRERLKVYEQESNNLLNFYKSSHKKIENINVESKTISQIFEEFKGML
mgnify:CR=1 FL=1